MNKTTILVLPYTHTLSHLSRPLEIAKYLSRSDYRIIFAGRSNKTGFIRQEGFSVEDIFEPDPDILYGNIRDKKIKFIDDKTLRMMIKADKALYNKVNPDLILSDGRFSAMISAQEAKIPHASIVNVSSTSFRSIPYVPLIKWIDLDTYPPKNLFTRWAMQLNIKTEIVLFNTLMKSFTKLTREKGLKTSVTATNCLCGTDVTLLADIPDFFPAENLPHNYHYIGPVTWENNSTQAFPDWWPIEKKTKKLVYLTMGTTGEETLFSKVYNAVKESDMLCIITTGGQSGDIQSIPGKIYVTDYMNGDAVMEIADLVICHGGNGTIYQALSHGVPVIGIPTIPDQEFNMRRVQALNAGTKISMEEAIFKPKLLTRAIYNFEKPPEICKTALTKLQKQLVKINGARTGAQILDQFIKTGMNNQK